jgi:hypothetical protein
MQIETATLADVPTILYPALKSLGCDFSKCLPTDELINIVKKIDREHREWGVYRKLAIHLLLFAAMSENTIEEDLCYAWYFLEQDMIQETIVYLNPFRTIAKLKQDRLNKLQIQDAIEYIKSLVKRSPESEFKTYDLQYRINNSSHEDLKQFTTELYDSMISQENLYRQIIKHGWGI